MKVFLLAVLTALSVYSARPSDPWIFMGVMREKPRMIMIALAQDFSAVYETGNCALYTSWSGPMQDGNELYSHGGHGNRGATFYPQGNILHRQSAEAQVSEVPLTAGTDGRPKSFSPNNEPPVPVWTLLNAGAEQQAEIAFKGYTLSNNYETATLRYRFTLPGGQQVDIHEVPEYAQQGSDPGMTRVITVSGLPVGYTVRLKLTGSEITKSGGGTVQESWSASGAGSIQGSYFQSGNGTTTITGTWR